MIKGIKRRVDRLITNKISVPTDLGKVLGVDAASEAGAAASGLSAQAINEIWQGVEDMYRSGAYPGISFCLRRHGHVVLNRSLGHARGNGPNDRAQVAKQLLQPGTPICLFSSSKAVTAILIHKLAEEGGVDLNQAVSHYLPEFGAEGKAATTVSEVLAHRGGFPTIKLPKGMASADLLLQWDRVIDMICRAPPQNDGAMAYHAITGGFILAEVLQRVTGRSIREYLDEKIRKPLGMTHFTYGLPPEHRASAALNYAAGQPVRFPIAPIVQRALIVPFNEVVEVSNTDAFLEAVVPAGNIFATAEELSRFFQMLLDEGAYNGQQVMKPETVARAVRPASNLGFDRTLMIPMRYSEGLMLGANPVGLYGPKTANAFGHLGFMNILGWADPSRDISVGLLVTGKAIVGSHLIALGKLLGTISKRCA